MRDPIQALVDAMGPNLDAEPVIRVPLPAIGPSEALEWVISQLVPTPAFEPAPWTSLPTS